MEDVNLLLSFLETEIYDGKKTLMGNGVVVNGDNILNLVKRIRLSLNAMNGTDLLNEANDKAQKIISNAEQRKEQILDESIVIREAKAIADKTVNEALALRKQIEDSTRKNLINMLNRVKKSLDDAGQGVEDAIAEISVED